MCHSRTRAFLPALAALAIGATPALAQSYDGAEPIGRSGVQSGAPVPTPQTSPWQRNSPFYVSPPASAAYGRRYPYGVRAPVKPPRKR
jgi:hypothetical protein